MEAPWASLSLLLHGNGGYKTTTTNWVLQALMKREEKLRRKRKTREQGDLRTRARDLIFLKWA